jgi:hypothetical protein
MELSELLIENAFLSQEFDIKGFFSSKTDEEKLELVRQSVSRLTSSQFLKKKNLYQELKNDIK